MKSLWVPPSRSALTGNGRVCVCVCVCVTPRASSIAALHAEAGTRVVGLDTCRAVPAASPSQGSLWRERRGWGRGPALAEPRGAGGREGGRAAGALRFPAGVRETLRPV